MLLVLTGEAVKNCGNEKQFMKRGGRLLLFFFLSSLAVAYVEQNHLLYQGVSDEFIPRHCSDYFVEINPTKEVLQRGGEALKMALMAKGRMEEIKSLSTPEYYSFEATPLLLRSVCRDHAKNALELARQSVIYSLKNLEENLGRAREESLGFASGRMKGVLNEDEESRRALNEQNKTGNSFGSRFYKKATQMNEKTIPQSVSELLNGESLAFEVESFNKKIVEAIESLNEEKAFLQQKYLTSKLQAKNALKKTDSEKLFLLTQISSETVNRRPYSYFQTIAGKITQAKRLDEESTMLASSAEKILDGKQTGFLSLAVREYSKAVEKTSEAESLANEGFDEALKQEAILGEKIKTNRKELEKEIESLKTDSFSYAYSLALLEKSKKDNKEETIGERVIFYSNQLEELKDAMSSIQTLASSSSKFLEVKNLVEKLDKAIIDAEKDDLDVFTAKQVLNSANQILSQPQEAKTLIAIENEVSKAWDYLLAQEILKGRELEEDYFNLAKFESVFNEEQKLAFDEVKNHFSGGIFQPRNIGGLKDLKKKISKLKGEVYTTLPSLLKKSLESTMKVEEVFEVVELDQPTGFQTTLNFRNIGGISFDKPILLTIPEQFKRRLVNQFEIAEQSPEIRLVSDGILLEKVPAKEFFIKIRGKKTLAKIVSKMVETLYITPGMARKKVKLSYTAEDDMLVQFKFDGTNKTQIITTNGRLLENNLILLQASKGENTVKYEYSLNNPMSINVAVKTTGNNAIYDFLVKNNYPESFQGVDYWIVQQSCSIKKLTTELQHKDFEDFFFIKIPAELESLEEKRFHITLECQNNTALNETIFVYNYTNEMKNNSFDNEKLYALEKITKLDEYLSLAKPFKELETQVNEAEKSLVKSRKAFESKNYFEAAEISKIALSSLKDTAKKKTEGIRCRDCATLFSAQDYLGILSKKENPENFSNQEFFEWVEKFSRSSQKFDEVFFVPEELRQSRAKSSLFQLGVSIKNAGEREQKSFADEKSQNARNALANTLKQKAQKLESIVEEQKNNAQKSLTLAEAHQKQFGNSETNPELLKAREFFEQERFFAAEKTAGDLTQQLKSSKTTGLVTANETQMLLGIAGIVIVGVLAWVFSRKEKPLARRL